MKVLVVGGGGREHALVWKLAQSPLVTEIFCAPGNAGIATLASCVPLVAHDIEGLVDFARRADIDLTVVGPEAPLVAGIVDAFKAKGLRIFGPSRAAAAIEGSKAWAKELMLKARIPTARYTVVDNLPAAQKYIKEHGVPVVVKADGLAAGKGVVVAEEETQALAAVEEMLAGRFGEAGRRIILEEKLEGEEVSVLAFCDGENVLPMVASQDHKRVFEGDQGPNTGGMGAYAPVPFYDAELAKEVKETILCPAVRALAEAGHPYVGVLYAGLMVTREGPKVLEFNCRFGDPEAQPLLMLLKTDLVEVILAALEGRLKEIKLEWHPGFAACVVLSAPGYPGDYPKGEIITGLDQVPEGVEVFHAGTAWKGGQVVTNGGRVLGVTARGATLEEALSHAYRAAEVIHFPGKHYRRDIGWRAYKLSPRS
ncbi:phosphoribosylamine--glycine ligase [Thermanaeromonas toyohensis ToBE]|uniref:Phosphoribosylamine--glycine ligase n=1 Tax=Thermanaeromonas toyohensis ToBE TaxID=698762 RepID=A0A1W1W2H0_9FIRM|nr:phosphoribosylamine--glycine ligase [Thermanaeromonas toyohensis]SMB99819.1 phosphoribosylamine--glycine ligase [Thermanaeromonas toyohensis ToBE]